MRFPDKIAVVTGAASGFGAAIAKCFAAEGASVVVADVAEYGGLAILVNNVDVPQFAASIRARSRVEEAAP